MKKFFYRISLFILLILVIFISISNNRYSSFSTENVLDSIDILSSDPFNGRLAGSNENLLTTDLIKNTFIENGVNSLNGEYLQSFNTICPVSTGSTPYFRIKDNGSIIDTLKYGVDFKEDMINFKENTFKFSINDKIKALTSYIDIEMEDSHILLYVPENNNFEFRSSFSSDFQYDAIILITEEAKVKILDSIKSGKELTLHIPFINEEKTISNVVGTIESYNQSAPPLIITAHFDHLGSDAAGVNYSGALDNASGISFLLELQRYLSSLIKPNRDIIFVALNAEEFGLLGSQDFVENNLFDIRDADVINFDMIGIDNFPISLTQGSKFEGSHSELLTSVSNICTNLDTEFNIRYEDSSDHASFNNLNIDSLTISHSDLTNIHTPNDTVEHISIEGIESIYDVVNKKILSSSYFEFIFIIYNPFVEIIIKVIFALMIIIPTSRRIKEIWLLNRNL